MPRLIPPVVVAGTVAAQTQTVLAVDEELRLTRFETADAGAVGEAFADPEIQRWNLRRFDGLDEVEGWVLATHEGWAAETAATWAIRAAGTQEVLGRITLYLRMAEGHGEVTYWVLPRARGRRIAPRAVRALTRWAHDEVGLHRLELAHSTQNPASCRVAERAGFRAEGTRRQAHRHTDGWHDMHLHAHLASDGGPGDPTGGVTPRGD